MTPSSAMSLESALARAVDRYGPGLLLEPDRLKLQLDLACPDAAADVAQILAGLADGIPQSQLAAHGEAELANLLRGQVDRLVARTGIGRARATWVVRTWALALALPTTGLDGSAAPAKRATAMPLDFASIVTPLSSKRRVPEAAPATAVPPVVEALATTVPPVVGTPATAIPPVVAAPVVAAPPDVVTPVIAAPPVVAPPVIAAKPVVVTPASPSPSVLPEVHEPVEAVAPVAPSSIEATPQQPTVFARKQDAPHAVEGAAHDASQDPAARTQPDAAPQPAAQHIAAAVTPGTSAPSQAPVEPTTGTSPARPAADARAAARPVPHGGGAVPTPRAPIPMVRKAPLTPAPKIPVPVPSGRPRQRWLAIASLVAVVVIVGIVTALRPDRDPREPTATTVTPTPGPSVAATAKPSAPVAAVGTPPTSQSGASDAGSASGPSPAPEPVAPVPASSSPIPAQGAGGASAPAAGSAAKPVAAPAPVVEPVARPAPPTIARVGVPKVTAGQPFRVVVEVAPGSAAVSSIERRVVSGTADRAAESIPTARLARTGSGEWLLPFRAIADPGRVVFELALVGAGGSSVPKPVEIRVTPGSAPVVAPVVAPAACTRSTCGSVAAVRDLEGVTPGSVRGYTVVVRMDDRTIETIVLSTRPRLGQRLRKVGNRFVAG